ncbi:pyridoxal phosphate-dependent aminotransferase [Rhabdaerophilum sp. SD176]|uniref:pyridoxal phosphate-dependent aminotransferase n=1 Tax=Rhabdaerophilum sp. SD176 TaxID=2983548 RepID=UPI0024E0132D|nr:pyridoxal phosphate-dependent aminotransferase [Rhabdaerophilum sp. SD176]
MMSPSLSSAYPIRANAAQAPSSGIVEVFDYGRGRPGLIPLWVGEGDMPTPASITAAASASLAAGETFYTYQAGLPSLRETIATYLGGMYGTPVSADRIYVTSGGMHALQIAVTMVAGAGDEVIVPTPAWPNFIGALTVSGATPREVPMRFGTTGWQLDLEALAAAVGPKTRAMVINSPANPTGWTASAEEIRFLMDLARRHGFWIIADEIYGRFYFDGPRAPSFRDVMREDDRLLFVQTMSKNWAMTGWRLGWIESPAVLGPTIVNLIQYSSSGAPVFIQRAAETAIREGEALIAGQVERARRNRQILLEAFSRQNRFRMAPPAGAFYLFFGIEGVGDTRQLAFRLIDEANVGLAPGTAFGAGGEGFLRLCYLRKSEDIAMAADRLVEAVARL